VAHSPELRRRNRLALKYFTAAILLFAVGYGLSWLSEQSFVSDAFKHKTAATPKPKPAASASPQKGNSTNATQSQASTKPGRQYTVQPGDTISAIAGANGLSFEELAQYNNIPYPYSLTVGQVIIIPGK
jgi:LysM repeat protein